MSVTVDWSAFNAAVREHASRETAKFYGLPRPTPRPLPASLPTPPAITPANFDSSGQFLRRALGIALVTLAVGAAVGLASWKAEDRVVTPVGATTSPSVPMAPSSVAAPVLPPNITSPDTTNAKPSGPEVVNYTRFTSRTLDGLRVVTGWDWANSNDVEPQRQFCYVTLPDPTGGAPRRADIAFNGVIIPYDIETMRPLTAEQHERSVEACTWFKLNPADAASPAPALSPDNAKPASAGGSKERRRNT